MKVLFAGGGTAGHVSPALAIADIVKSKYPSAEFAFVGREGGDENKAIINEGYALHTIQAEGLSRSLSPKNVKVLINLIRSVKEAKKIIKTFKPSIVIGTGGYVSLPVLLAAFHIGVPTLLHESNAFPGLVTRKLGKKCTAVALGVEEAASRLKYSKNVSVVGNPVKASFHTTDKAEARKKIGIKKNDILIVSFGGSGGAEKLNEAVIGVMREYSSLNNRLAHIHASGRKNYPKVKEICPELCRGKNGAKIIPYIENMPDVLSAADISITRSGAMTLAELSCVDCIPILIPSPNVAANHQYYNAKAIADAGRAVLLEEKNLSKGALIKAIKEAEEQLSSKKLSFKPNIRNGQKDCRTLILQVISDAISKQS